MLTKVVLETFDEAKFRHDRAIA